MNKQFLIILFPIFLTGCATLSKEECLQGHWFGIGRKDGEQGYPATRFYEHEKACADYQVIANLDVYQKGHLEGVRSYCTPSNGFNLGKQTKSYPDICPKDLEQPFLIQYEEGLKSALNAIQEEIGVENDEFYRQLELLRFIDNEGQRKKAKEELDKIENTVKSLETQRKNIIQLLDSVKARKTSY